jgi:transposase-like protein
MPISLRLVAESVLQLIMEADVDGVIGAGRFERSSERQTWRNGYRDRTLETRLGPLNLKIPSCARAATSPASWSPGRPSRRRWCR